MDTAMRISFLRPMQPCTLSPPTETMTLRCSRDATPPSMLRRKHHRRFQTVKCAPSHCLPETKLGGRWTEYQGLHNWDGLLDPLDNDLRNEILRYGRFVEAAYNSFDPFSGQCRHPKSSLLSRTGLAGTGYRLTKYLRATSSIELPRWFEEASNSIATRSSWIGYVAVCEDRNEIVRLGRRDIVIAYRGTATCLEWVENLRASLTQITGNKSDPDQNESDSEPMVESGFLSLYSSESAASPSLKQTIGEEVSRLLHTYRNEPVSLTITGHSLGAALAALTAYDIKVKFPNAPLVTVVSFGGPRVGNRGFRWRLENQGTKVLRIVNSDDVVTKMPGFVLDDDNGGVRGLGSWIQRRLESQWLYSEIGKELRLNNTDSSDLNGMNIAMSHDLRTYLHRVQGFGVSGGF